MTNVIQIKFSEDLGSKAKNELRYRMELARWREEWRQAESMGDWMGMQYLQWKYLYIGLP